MGPLVPGKQDPAPGVSRMRNDRIPDPEMIPSPKINALSQISNPRESSENEKATLLSVTSLVYRSTRSELERTPARIGTVEEPSSPRAAPPLPRRIPSLPSNLEPRPLLVRQWISVTGNLHG